jgi:hypothetical protein
MRVRPRTALLWSLPFVAIAAYVLYLRHSYNWGPPEIFAQALASPSTGREGLIETLETQYLIGTDQAVLRSTLLKQGFGDAPQARMSCIKADAGKMAYGPCPAGTQQMTYDYNLFGDLVCGTRHISINWSADPNGKIARLEATRYVPCL